MDAKQVFGRLPDGYQQQITARFCSKCGSPCTPWQDGLPHVRCTACGHMQFVNPAPGVVVVVADEDRVLLGRRAAVTGYGGAWCLPGGHIEFGEDYLTAGLRETLEETGISVEITGLISVVSNFWQHSASTLVVVLLAKPQGGEPTVNHEVSEVAWFDWQELPEMAFEADVHIIQRYFTDREAGARIDPAFTRLDIDPSTRELVPAERRPR